ncbi:hypothetical protein [Xanthobacter tagetidis]|uniref:hypothetical protein n=1 Tax=Xanthobacter tagetidis TaxID=60216 RepID=UPI00372AF3CF
MQSLAAGAFAANMILRGDASRRATIAHLRPAARPSSRRPWCTRTRYPALQHDECVREP